MAVASAGSAVMWARPSTSMPTVTGPVLSLLVFVVLPFVLVRRRLYEGLTCASTPLHEVTHIRGVTVRREYCFPRCRTAHSQPVRKDYWDFGGLVNHAPADWMEELAKADTSWMFDATGLI